jgi:hypothetical protein
VHGTTAKTHAKKTPAHAYLLHNARRRFLERYWVLSVPFELTLNLSVAFFLLVRIRFSALFLRRGRTFLDNGLSAFGLTFLDLLLPLAVLSLAFGGLPLSFYLLIALKFHPAFSCASRSCF